MPGNWVRKHKRDKLWGDISENLKEIDRTIDNYEIKPIAVERTQQKPTCQKTSENPLTNIRLCLFDLDQTLLRTDDLEAFRGPDFIGITDYSYTNNLHRQFKLLSDPYIYGHDRLTSLRRRFPNMYWGVFTRAPHHYAENLLHFAYPEFDWDCLIAYEDVKKTKPAGFGVKAAMHKCGIQKSSEVLLVGDSWQDIQAGYHGECWTVLDKSSWKHPHSKQHFSAKELVPDAIIDQPSKLGLIITNPELALPELEYRLASTTDSRSEPRFDRIDYFSPDRNHKLMITVLGRYFTGKQYRHPTGGNHQLTQQILEHKESIEFPVAWVQAIRTYLENTCKGADPIVTVIPFKYGRTPRLEALLEQVKLSDQRDPIRPGTCYSFKPKIFAFTEDAISSHKNYLGKYQRFQQAASSLYVIEPHDVVGRKIIVFDDVVTTGASLFAARDQLKHSGAFRVSCMALAKTISRIKQ